MSSQRNAPHQGEVWQNYYIAMHMSGGGCGCYRNANIDETDILVGQLGHASWTTRMLYASPPVTDNQPGSAEQPQGRLGVLLSAQCTLYKGHVSQDFTLRTGLIPIKEHCVSVQKVAQHNTAQHSAAADNMSQSKELLASQQLGKGKIDLNKVLFRPPSDANDNQ